MKQLYVQQKVIDIKVHCLKSKANFFVNILSKCAEQVEEKKPKMIACLILHRGDAMKKLFWVMVLASEDGISRCHKNSRGVVVYDPLAMCTWNVFYRLTIINNIPLRVPATAKFINIITQYNGEIISWGKLVKTWILSSSNTD